MSQRENGSGYNIKLPSKSSDVFIEGEASFYGGESKGVAGKFSDFGPSIYLNKESSSINLAGAFSIKPLYGQRLIRSNFLKNETKWEADLVLSKKSNPSKMVKKDNYFYITDKGARQIIKYNPETNDPPAYLGKSDWDWRPAGITVAESEEEEEEDDLYITDVANNRIIKTKMDGSGWIDSVNIKKDYYKKLILTGEEELRYKYNNLTDAGVATDVSLVAGGHNRHDVKVVSSQGYLIYDFNDNKFDFVSKKDKLFGDRSFNFNGGKRLIIDDHKDFQFGKDSFIIDFWVKFNSLDHDQTFVSKEGAYEFKWISGSGDSGDEPALHFSAYHRGEEGGNEGVISVTQKKWNPEVSEWYHISLVARGGIEDRYSINVDGQKLTESTANNEPIQSDNLTSIIDAAGKDLVIGASYHSYLEEGDYYLDANIDNLRIIKENPIQYYNQYSYNPNAIKYFFNNPQDLTHLGGYLYVVDSGHDRIVKMNKAPRDKNAKDLTMDHWDTFGTSGDGAYQFSNPSYITHNFSDGEGAFYIADTGNNRIVKTDIAATSNRFKDNDFSAASWQTLDLSDFYEELDESAMLSKHKKATDSDFKSINVYSKYFNSYRSSAWSKNIASYLKNTPYENSRIKVAIKGSGSFDVSLTDNLDFSNSSFRLTENWSEGGNNMVSFELPKSFVLGKTSNNLYLDIGGGGQIKFVKVILSKEFKIGGLHVNQDDLYITDKENGVIIKCKGAAQSMNCNNVIVGGQQNPQEKQENQKNLLRGHKYVFKMASPKDVYHTMNGDEDVFYVLDGINDSALTITNQDSSSY